MLRIQVVPRGNENIYQLLRDKIDKEARVFAWAKKKVSILHLRKPGQIRIRDADGILVAHTEGPDNIIGPFVERLAAWFPAEIAAINIQVLEQDTTKKKDKKK